MKRLALLAVCFATLTLTSCGILGSAAGNTVAQTLGQTCGSAVLSLYNSYKASGNLDLTNANNLTNALTLATAYTQLRQNKDNKSYRDAFTSGLILSSAGLITNQNAGNFLNALLSASELGNVNSSSSSSQIKKTTPAVTNLFSTLN